MQKKDPDTSESNVFIGGAYRDRTDDPPACKAGALPAELKPHVYLNSMVGLNGLEPTTSPLSGVRSNHLSYRPN